jgi:hypothetical protein
VKRNRSALLWVPVLVAGVLIGTAATATATLPSGVTPVAVAAGTEKPNVDGHLRPAASIEGHISAFAGGTVSALVQAFAGNKLIRTGSTNGSGDYLIGGLPANATGYAVCVSSASGGNSTTGYLGRCYKTATWNGSTIPSGAVRVPLTPGQHETGINITLRSGAAIAGKVTNNGGTALNGVNILAKNRSSGRFFYSYTDGTGHYVLKDLTPSSTGYAVCFNPATLTAGTYGYRPECFNNKAWGGGSIPSTATPVSVSLGHTHAGISAALPVGGAISGTLTDAGNGNTLANGGVAIFSSTGRYLTSAPTNAQGHYVAKGLAAASADRVCASGPDGVVPGVSYKGKCWKNVAWNGGSLPSGTTGVSVSLGHNHTGINFRLTRVTVQLGSIGGRITERAGGQPLQNALVHLFALTGTSHSSTTTDATGHYSFSNVRPNSTGYVVCAKASSSTFSTTPTPATGWAPRCYADAAWSGYSYGAPPSAATKLPLSAGQDRTHINFALRVGGKISGTVTQYGTATTLPGIPVQVFTATGRSLISSYTQGDGTYSVTGLSPVSSTSGYIVCFYGYQYGVAGYLSQCFLNRPWDGNY